MAKISRKRFLLIGAVVATGALAQSADQVLYGRAIGDIERRDFVSARLTLNTLVNSYPSSTYVARAKLAIAVSWLRQGDARALTMAEAEYRDFIRFYPGMKQAADTQVGEPLRKIREQQANTPR